MIFYSVAHSKCMIKIFRGAGVVTPSKPPPPNEQFLPLPTPCFKMFWKDPLMTPHPHHPTSSTFHCYPLPIHHPFPPKKFDHTLTGQSNCRIWINHLPRGWTWHIYRQGSVEYFWRFLMSKICILLGAGQSCCIFLGCQINVVFLSVLCLQRYF